MGPLTEAGIHYGEAFCVPSSKMDAPFSSLTSDEQSCVRRLGMHWEQDVMAKLGGSSSRSDPPKRHAVRSQSGHDMGSLTVMDGEVTLCLKNDSQMACSLIGRGDEAVRTAQKLLPLMGLEVTD